jgi:hypothetical protein
MIKKTLFGLTVALVVWGTVAMLPDFIRYMKIRQM